MDVSISDSLRNGAHNSSCPGRSNELGNSSCYLVSSYYYESIPEAALNVSRREYFLTCSDSFQSFESVRVFANQKDERCGLRIRLGPTLFPFLQGSFVDPKLAGKNSS